MTIETIFNYPPPDRSGDETSRYRDLVVICFRAILHREPEEVDAVAFTNALLNAMPIYDFISELMSTPEYRKIVVPINESPRSCLPLPEAPAPLNGLTSSALGLLQTRLADKGCLFQLGPTPGFPSDECVDPVRMERVMRTLAVLDAL